VLPKQHLPHSFTYEAHMCSLLPSQCKFTVTWFDWQFNKVTFSHTARRKERNGQEPAANPFTRTTETHRDWVSWEGGKGKTRGGRKRVHTETDVLYIFNV